MSKVCIFLAEGFEEIEGLTVVDLLRRAEIEVLMASISDQINVTGAHGICVKADILAKEVNYEDMDMVVLPGGMPGTLNLGDSPVVCQQAAAFAKAGKLVGAICAAPSILGKLGLLDGKEAVCYPGFEEKLEGARVSFEPVIADENIITSRGLGTAIDFAAVIIEKLIRKEKALEILDSIIYKK